MIVSTRPNIKDRTQKTTPYKRIVQSNCVRAILDVEISFGGDLYQTPGPGHVAINYAIFNTLLRGGGEYYMVEIFRDVKDRMAKEVRSVKNRGTVPIHLYCGELFDTTLKAKPNSVKFVDACLCATPRKLVKDGILDSLRDLIHSYVTTYHWYFLLTFSQRYGANGPGGSSLKDKNLVALQKIKSLLSRHGGRIICEEKYQDGAPMRQIVWVMTNKSVWLI